MNDRTGRVGDAVEGVFGMVTNASDRLLDERTKEERGIIHEPKGEDPHFLQTSLGRAGRWERASSDDPACPRISSVHS